MAKQHIINISHHDMVVAAKENASTKPGMNLGDSFNSFLDGAQWILRQLDGHNMEDTTGTRLIIANGRLVSIDLSKVEYVPAAVSDEVANKLLSNIGVPVVESGANKNNLPSVYIEPIWASPECYIPPLTITKEIREKWEKDTEKGADENTH